MLAASTAAAVITAAAAVAAAAAAADSAADAAAAAAAATAAAAAAASAAAAAAAAATLQLLPLRLPSCSKLTGGSSPSQAIGSHDAEAISPHGVHERLAGSSVVQAALALREELSKGGTGRQQALNTTLCMRMQTARVNFWLPAASAVAAAAAATAAIAALAAAAARAARQGQAALQQSFSSLHLRANIVLRLTVLGALERLELGERAAALHHATGLCVAVGTVTWRLRSAVRCLRELLLQQLHSASQFIHLFQLGFLRLGAHRLGAENAKQAHDCSRARYNSGAMAWKQTASEKHLEKSANSAPLWCFSYVRVRVRVSVPVTASPPAMQETCAKSELLGVAPPLASPRLHRSDCSVHSRGPRHCSTRQPATSV